MRGKSSSQDSEENWRKRRETDADYKDPEVSIELGSPEITSVSRIYDECSIILTVA